MNGKELYAKHRSTGHLITWNKINGGKWYTCPTNDTNNSPITIHTAHSTRFYSKPELERINLVNILHDSMEHPGHHSLAQFCESQSVLNNRLSATDVQNWVDTTNCDKCMRGKPLSEVGTHPSYSKIYAQHPGELLHVDVIYIGGKPRLLA